MTKARRFEDLQCWQKGRELANAVFDLTGRAEFSKNWHLCHQIEDAGGSVMHNIAEGQDAGSDAEFARFLRIARRSASEVQSELYLALDRGYITEIELQETYALADDVKRLINGLIAYLRKSASGGSQVREAAISYMTGELDPDAPEA